MAKHPDYVLRKNAQRGAITTWCPNCKRKAALSRYFVGGRSCRYCKYLWAGNGREHKKLYQAWEEEQKAPEIISPEEVEDKVSRNVNGKAGK